MNTQRPTPRTDAETQRLKVVLDAACTEGPWEAPICSVGVEFARDLERENEAMRTAIQEAHDALSRVTNEAKAREGLQCGSPSMVTMYLKAEAVDESRSALAALKPFLPA